MRVYGIYGLSDCVVHRSTLPTVEVLCRRRLRCYCRIDGTSTFDQSSLRCSGAERRAANMSVLMHSSLHAAGSLQAQHSAGRLPVCQGLRSSRSPDSRCSTAGSPAQLFALQAPVRR